MTEPTKTKDCVACAESIKADAVLCKHCKTRQDDPSFQAVTLDTNQTETTESSNPTFFAESPSAAPQNSKLIAVGFAGLLLVVFGTVVSTNLDLGTFFSSANGAVTNNPYSQGYEFAKSVEAETNQDQFYAYAFCSTLTAESQSFENQTDSDAFVEGCMAYVMQGYDAASSSASGSSTTETTEENSSQTPTQTASAYQVAKDLMNESLNYLNVEDPDGYWYIDTFTPPPLVVGVLLDDYSVYPDGCAAWWFKNENDFEVAFDNGSINFFSDFYQWWIYDSGPVLLVVANSETDDCYWNIKNVLELQD